MGAGSAFVFRTVVDPSLEAAGEPSLVRTPRKTNIAPPFSARDSAWLARRRCLSRNVGRPSRCAWRMRSVGILNWQRRFEERGLGVRRTPRSATVLAHQDGHKG